MRKAKKSPDEMTFLEHLEELRKRLFNAFIAVIIAVIPAWIFSKEIYNILAFPVKKYLPEGQDMAYLNLTEPFMVYMKVAFITAIFVTSPYIFLQVWHFVAPGLYRKEKKYIWPFVIFTTVFFCGGAVFGYFIVFPFACRFFINLGADFKAILSIKEYLTLSLRVILGIALVFELPTLIFFLSRMGVITARFMVRNFKYAVLVIFIIAAVITPTPDMITQSFIAVPMLALYGLGILIALVFGKKGGRKRTDDEDGPAG